MTVAFILCPCTAVDILEINQADKSGVYKGFLDFALKEWEKSAISRKVKFRVFLPRPVKKSIINIIVDKVIPSLENGEEQESMLGYIKTVFSVFEEEGTMPYDMAPFEATIELGRELNDEYDIYIVSEYEEKIKEALENYKETLLKKLKETGATSYKFQVGNLEDAIFFMKNLIDNENNSV